MIWFYFILTAFFLVFFSYKLCGEGKKISENTHISESMIGIIFLAVATSFPEVITAVSSIHFFDKTALAFGDIIGSVIFNFMIIGAVDYMYGKGRVYLKVSYSNERSALLIFVILIIYLLSVCLRKFFGLFDVAGIGIEGLIILFIYFFYMKNFSEEDTKEKTLKKLPEISSKDKFLMWFRFSCLLGSVILVGIILAWVSSKIVETTTISETFFGCVFLGISTSLPEVIVSLSAMRIGAYHMAIGNILGSNIFDLAILPVLDFFNKKPILGGVTKGQILSIIVASVISVIFITAFKLKHNTVRRINGETLLILLVGLIGFVLTYLIE
ncbi:MAG: hypothetical protein HQL29_03940 [Candidatus Omnitrophica bacterium]|nr:hypothetical protein [Candidatus Omnitrophota bacterium]